MKTFLISVASCMMATSVFAAPVAVSVDNSFSIQRANVWVDNGLSAKTFHLENWSENAQFISGAVKVSSKLVTTTSLKSVDVLVNDVATSYPAIISPLPKVSLVGLDAVSNQLGDALDSATLSLEPNGGDFNDTVAIKLALVGALGETQKVEYRIDNQEVMKKELTMIEGKNAIELFLSRYGKHTLEYKLASDDKYKSAVFTLTNVDNKRDSDGDGIPDVVEVELGSDPFEVESSDGWSIFDKYIRGNDINDTDGDGWSDFDEKELRNTAYNDNKSKPTATSLYGVEYKVRSVAQENDINKTSLQRVSFVTMESQVVYDSKILEKLNRSQTYYNIIISPVTGPNLSRFLARGEIPTVRMPASVPLIERVREDNTSNSWVAKAFLPSSEDISVENFYKVFQTDTNVTDVNLSSFSAAYIEYLKAHLVVDKEMAVDNNTSFGVAVAELAMKTRSDSNVTLLLGHPDFMYDYKAYKNTLESLRASERGWNEFANDLASMLISYPLVVDDMNNSMQDDGNLTEMRLARYMQQTLPQTQQYKASLMSIVSFPDADKQAQTTPAISVFLADVDSDGDGLSNKEEVLALAYSNPLEADSDHDGLDDANDPCVLDATNSCMNDDVANEDSDGDGIVDSIDNCPFDANADQTDSDGDGIGDVCAKKGVVIVNPRTNITLFSGESYTFEARKTIANIADVIWEVNTQRAINPAMSYTHTFSDVGITTVCVYLEGNNKAKSCVNVDVKQAPQTQVTPTLYAAAKLEGDSGYSEALVEISLSDAPQEALTYSYETKDYTATSGEDYNQTVGKVVFNIGKKRQYIRVPIKGDTKFESDESFDFLLTHDGATQPDASLRVTIINDDVKPDTNDTNTTPGLDFNISSFAYFALDDSTYGNEPWMSDGSVDGTKLLKDMLAGSTSSYPGGFTKVNNQYLYFTAYNVDNNISLYRSAGTADTTLSLGAVPGFEASDFIDIEGVLYYIVIADNSVQLYKLDGDTQTYLADISSGYMSADGAAMLYAVGTDLFFVTDLTNDSESTKDLYKYNTATNELSLVKDFYPGADYYEVGSLVASSTHLYFVLDNMEIWTSDGSDAGTTALIKVTNEQEYISYMRYLNGVIYYVVVNSNTYASNVYSYEVSSATTTTLQTYDDTVSVREMYVVGDSIYMQTRTSSETQLLQLTQTTATNVWATTDYTTAFASLGTHFILATNGAKVYNEKGEVLVTLAAKESVMTLNDSLSDKLFFEVYNYESGSVTLYVTDFTVDGTKALTTRNLPQ